MNIRPVSFLLVCCLLVLTHSGFAQQFSADQLPVMPYWETFTPRQYPGEQQNRAIIQKGQQGFLVANSGGMLQHSDRRWRVYGRNEITFITSLLESRDLHNTIWAGSFSNIGYFRQTADSTFHYHSLTEQLPDSVRNFSSVSEIVEFDDRVYFLSDLYLLVYDNEADQAEVASPVHANIPAGDHISSIMVWRDKLHLFTRGGFLFTLDTNGDVQKMELSGGPSSAIVAGLERQDGLLLASKSSGLSLYDGETMSRLSTEADEFLAEQTVTDLAVFSDGRIAVSTKEAGTVVLRPNGTLDCLLAEKTGLAENIHNGLLVDHQQDLWIAGNESITKVYTGVLLRHLNGDQFGFGDALQIHQSKQGFWVGAIEGLFHYDYKSSRADILTKNGSDLFRKVPIPTSAYWDFWQTDGSLWTASNAGIYRIDGGAKEKLFSLESFLIRPLSDSQTLIVTSNGVHLLERANGRWRDAGALDVANFYIYTLVVADQTTFWAGGTQGQLVKVTYDASNDKFTEQRYGEDDGLLSSGVYEPVWVGDSLVVNSNRGLMSYHPARDRFKPLTQLNSRLGGWGEYLSRDPSGSLWAIHSSDSYRGVVKLNGEDEHTWQREATAFELSKDHFGDFIEIDDDEVWVGSTESIMVHDLYGTAKEEAPAVTVWGVTSLFDQRSISENRIPDEIAYDQKQVRFELGSSSFRYPEKNQYRYQVNEGGWSGWRSDGEIVMDPFFPGEYRVQVQTRNFRLQRSEVLTLRTRLLAPWYMSGYALAIYGLLLIGGIVLTIRGISRHNVKRQLEALKLKEAEKLIELDEMKNRLFANISHEFRTPLTISHGLVKRSLKQTEGEKQIEVPKRDLVVVNRNLNRLNDMVNQIIDLTKADKDHLKLTRNYYRGDQLVRLSAESFRSLAEFHGHRFELDEELDDIVLYVDRAKLEIILNNLISNAIKYTGEGGQILIKAYEANGRFNLLVSDNGPGIPKGDEEAIFERFYRIERAEEAYVEGMGVGLELSRTLARLHGGDITLLADREVGAGFLLTLPIAVQEEPKQVLQIDETEIEEMTETVMDQSMVADVTQKGSAEAGDLLLVEDNPDMMAYVQEILQQTARIRTAANGKEAIDQVKSRRPDLILTDLMMPEMDGMALIKRLAEHEAWRDIPVIVLTAKAVAEHRTELLRIGVVDYITKPFEPDQLMLKVRNLLKYAHRRQNILETEGPEIEQVESLKTQVVEYIQEHLADSNLTVDELVAAFPQSRRSFYRNIQKSTGMTPSELIREVRFRMALKLIHSGETYTLKEVATAVGYNSGTSFRKAFEKAYGKHPLE